MLVLFFFLFLRGFSVRVRLRVEKVVALRIKSPDLVFSKFGYISPARL